MPGRLATIRTLDRSDASAPLRLLQITDCHLYAGAGTTLYGIDTAASFAAVLEEAMAGEPVDAVIATGDLAQDESRGAYELLRGLLEPFGLPTFCLPGNHDAPELMAQLLEEPPFHFGGTVLAGGWCIPLLDTHVPGETGGKLGRTQLDELEAILREHRERHALVCLHHQPVPVGSPWIDAIGLEDGKELLDLVTAIGNVRAIIWGHVHQEFDQYRGTCRLLATPSTCAQFEPRRETSAFDSISPGWRRLELRPDGTLTTAVGRTRGFAGAGRKNTDD